MPWPGQLGGITDGLFLIVALVARRWHSEIAIDMTSGAGRPPMVVVQRLSGDVVIELSAFPAAVARIAVRLQTDEGNRFVAAATTLVAVIAAQQPAGLGVLKRRRLGLTVVPVAAVATRLIIDGMATRAGLMVLFR